MRFYDFLATPNPRTPTPQQTLKVSLLFIYFSERGARAWGPHGEWKAKKDSQAADHLLQLPARCAPEALPEGAVPRPARESRAGGSAGPHSDAGKRAQRGALPF